jgi:ATP-dependent DNA helicase RecG
MTSNKLSNNSKTRMETMVRTNDGFEIAEVDLKLRGPGDLMGTQQSGVLNLQIADLVKDRDILNIARNYAVKILKEDTSLEKPINAILRVVFMEISKRKNIWNYIS